MLTIDKAASLLQQGQLVAIPTETVYGLGGRADLSESVAAIYALKQRPSHNPLIVHVANVTMAQEVAQFNPAALKLAEAFWPGPLTLVLPLKPEARVCSAATAGLPTVAVRIPAHPLALELLEKVGNPIVAPSANPSGRLSPTATAHVSAYFPQLAVMDGGACLYGLESTIIGFTDLLGSTPALLRAGSLTAADIEAAIGTRLSLPNNADITAPGQLLQHYAPRLPLRLNVLNPKSNEVLLTFGQPVPTGAGGVLSLSPSGNLTEAAHNLFACLHRADSMGFFGIAIMPIPQQGIGVAINDRLQRAAAR